MMIKCISLLSGGLDSILATRLMKDQGLDVEAMTLVHDFHPHASDSSPESPPRKAARQIGVPLHEVYQPERFLRMLRNPEFGYGSNMNPCIDCHLFLLQLAKERMAETGARFAVTGEVLGERPMSQRRETMLMIARRAGLEGYVLRPLSAKLLPPTVPETEGWVDRERLYAIRGRSRQPQLALAAELGIAEFPSPAGGCLLTDPEFSARLRDLMAHEPDFTAEDVRLLKVGRHFRLKSAGTALGRAPRVVVGRDAAENVVLAALARSADFLLDAVDYSGPTTLVRGSADEAVLKTAASLTARYGKGRAESSVAVLARQADGAVELTLNVAPADEALVRAHRIGLC